MKRSSCRIYVISLAVILTVPFVFLPNAALATEYSFTPIDVPGASYTYAFGINESGIIVGYYGNATGGEHGYLYSGGNLTYPIDVPGASYTYAFGINDSGIIVGYYIDATGQHGYLYDGVKFTPIDVPGASYTVVLGINDSGIIVGYYIDASWRYHGYLYDGVNFTPIDVPGASYTVAFGINHSGIIVGYYDDATGEHGYLYDGVNFTYPIDVPGASYTDAIGINDSGIIVGYYGNATESHGYLYNGGNLTNPIDVPGAFYTDAIGFNESGIIVGYYGDATGSHGFVASPVSKPVSKPVSIDIKPGDHSNSINPKSKGKIPVAILSTKDFDAPNQIDLKSLTFGRTGDEKSLAFCHAKHANRDGLRDLVCHFYTQQTGFQCGDTQGILKGKTKDGTPIEGSDSVRIVPCKCDNRGHNNGQSGRVKEAARDSEDCRRR